MISRGLGRWERHNCPGSLPALGRPDDHPGVSELNALSQPVDTLLGSSGYSPCLLPKAFAQELTFRNRLGRWSSPTRKRVSHVIPGRSEGRHVNPPIVSQRVGSTRRSKHALVWKTRWAAFPVAAHPLVGDNLDTDG